MILGCNIGENGKYEDVDSCEELMLRYTVMIIYCGKNWMMANGLVLRG